ncbi:Nudix hydrolase 3 [Platanthera zijinensis]|uniref:Nudix hydrolase 3 n=1 Tax=Platanthera zijinensis TaxID=2320716 RepID=A0AAP0BVL3_9ASPA
MAPEASALNSEEDKELLDVLTKAGEKTGVSKSRRLVHRDGDYHRSVHVWIYSESTQELLLQRRADCKDSWPGLWDISSAGHISAGDSSLITARRELHEELGINLPRGAFELIFVFLQECVLSDGKFINNEYNDVYLVTTLSPIPQEAFILQESEVSSVKYIFWGDYKNLLANGNKEYVPYDVHGQYNILFDVLEQRYNKDIESRSILLQKKLNRYAPIHLDAKLNGLSEADKKALNFIIKASLIIEEIFYEQVWYGNDKLRDWLKEHSSASDFDKLKWMYYSINKSPWSCLDENKAFLTTADSATKLLEKSTRTVPGWKGLEYRVSFPLLKPPGANFYPPDMEKLDSKLDVTIGPYETYEDAIFGYKATFEAFIGIRDDVATSQVKLFGDNLQLLQLNLPLDNIYKAGDVVAAPIRVINLIFNAGDVKGPQTVAFNLPNDERIVSERGTSMVMLKNISEAKFKHILQPIANLCISEEQQEYIDFESFFTHTICHECCHGIGPHTIYLPSGQKSTVRLELQELHSAMEEAKADIVGLWALRFLINQELLPRILLRSMYVSFLAGCFRSVRFGLEEAHGKGQALQFNWLYEKEAFILHMDGTFSVDFEKVEAAVEDLSREILTIQARGDKGAAKSLLQKYAQMTQPLSSALLKLESFQVPVDIALTFGVMDVI